LHEKMILAAIDERNPYRKMLLRASDLRTYVIRCRDLKRIWYSPAGSVPVPHEDIRESKKSFRRAK
jgi:hypothetical protein